MWEYKTINPGSINRFLLEQKELSKLGAEGWELVTVLELKRQGSSWDYIPKQYIFKRKAQ